MSDFRHAILRLAILMRGGKRPRFSRREQVKSLLRVIASTSAGAETFHRQLHVFRESDDSVTLRINCRPAFGRGSIVGGRATLRRGGPRLSWHHPLRSWSANVPTAL